MSGRGKGTRVGILKRVLYHFRTRGTGPEGVHIAGIAEGFEAAGYRVTFVSPSGRDPRELRGSNPYRQTKEGLVQKIIRNAPQAVFEASEMAYNRVAISRMLPLASNCDWVYERYAFFCHAALTAGTEAGRPYALEVNELSGDERVRKQVFTGLCARNERRVLVGAQAVFPVSRYLAERILEQGVSSSRIHVMPNGVDAAHFFERPRRDREAVRRDLGLEPHDHVFAFVGWFVPWHQLERLLEAFAEGFRGRPNRKLVLAGDGPLRGQLIEAAARLGITNQLVLPGAVKYDNIPEFLTSVDVGVVPAVNAFRSPIKLFEYMAAGLPVVGGDVDALRSVLPAEQRSLLFDQEDFGDLVRALKAADGASRELGSVNQELCRRLYTYQNHARSICEIMEG